MNSTLLVSQLPNILSSRVEKFSVRKYDENGEKQRKGMLTVLEMLREKYRLPPSRNFLSSFRLFLLLIFMFLLRLLADG